MQAEGGMQEHCTSRSAGVVMGCDDSDNMCCQWWNSTDDCNYGQNKIIIIIINFLIFARGLSLKYIKQ